MTFSGAQAAGRSKALQSNSSANFIANSAINVATAPNNNPGHKPACDRCKGQKLRCVWECGSDICRRCRRAQAVCQQPTTRPFGRPRRSVTHNTSSTGQGQPNSRVWLPGDTNNTPAEFQENNPTIQMPTTDDEDRASSPHAHATLNPPRYLGLAALSADPNVQLNNISSSHNGHEYTLNWEAAPFANPSDAHLRKGSAFDKSQYIHTTTDNTKNATNADPFLNFGSDIVSSDLESNHSQWLKELGDLNVALYQHPLHPKPPTLSLADDNCASSSGSSGTISRPTTASNTPLASLSGLQMGRLLHMTSQLEDLTKQTHTAEYALPTYNDSSDIDSFGAMKLAIHDRSTLFQIVGCYARLEQIYTQTLATLADIKQCGPLPDDTYQLIPRVIVDGCPVEYCQIMQLDSVIYICEQTLDKIRQIMNSLRADM